MARVVLPQSLVPSLITAMRDNLAGYQARFGPPPALPMPPNPPPPAPIDEIYSQLKLPEELMSGVYANAVMIAHTPAEFAFDFITNFYPRSAVSCRVICRPRRFRVSSTRSPDRGNNFSKSKAASIRRWRHRRPANSSPIYGTQLHLVPASKEHS